MLVIDWFSPRLPTSRGQLQRKWNWPVAGRSQGFQGACFVIGYWGVFHSVPETAPGSGWGGRRAIWLALEPGHWPPLPASADTTQLSLSPANPRVEV